MEGEAKYLILYIREGQLEKHAILEYWKVFKHENIEVSEKQEKKVDLLIDIGKENIQEKIATIEEELKQKFRTPELLEIIEKIKAMNYKLIWIKGSMDEEE